MPIIRYSASNFGPSWGGSLQGEHDLTVTWADLVWAAITVGKPGVAHLLAHGWHSVSDTIVRAHTIYASLFQIGNSLEKSTLYRSLDPTEKGATSYFLGMVAAKLIASHLLQAPWLFHLSMFKSSGGTASLINKSEPDLIGRTRKGEWIVLEAKGRTHEYSTTAMKTAKLQTRQLRWINKQPPVLRAAVQAYFDPDLRFSISDPDDFDPDARDLQIDLRDSLQKYYSGFTQRDARLTREQHIDSRPFVVQDYEDIGVSIGIDKRLIEVLRAQGVTDSLPIDEQAAVGKPSGFLVYPDGLAVSLDGRWAEEKMRNDTPNRRYG